MKRGKKRPRAVPGTLDQVAVAMDLVQPAGLAFAHELARARAVARRRKLVREQVRESPAVAELELVSGDEQKLVSELRRRVRDSMAEVARRKVPTSASSASRSAKAPPGD